MRQRVAFLRTLVAGKPVLALDEPFASLDAITRAEMQAWLAEALAADPRTVVLVTHDVEEALYLSDRVAVLSARPARVVEELSAPAPRAADRDAAVTDPEFVAVRERAMAALHEGAMSAGALLAYARKPPGPLPLLLLAALIGAWQIAASTGALADLLDARTASSSPPPPKSPPPYGRTARCSPKTPGSPCRRSCSASSAGSPPGSAFAVLLRLSATLRRAFYPLMVASQAIPILVIAPILVVWFGFGIGPKLVGRRADLLLPDRRGHAPTGCARSIPRRPR